MVDARVVIQLADCSCIRPEGLLENMIVKVHDFIYPVDFYVIKTAGSESAGSSGVLLGRPFLKTTKTIINVFDGTLFLDYYGEKYTLSMKEATKKLTDMEDLHSVEDIASPVYEYSMEELLQEGYGEVGGNNEIEREVVKWNQEVQAQGLTDQEIYEVIMDFCIGSQAAWSSGAIQPQKEKNARRWEKTGMEKRPLPLKANPAEKRMTKASQKLTGSSGRNEQENLIRIVGAKCNKGGRRRTRIIVKQKLIPTVPFFALFILKFPKGLNNPALTSQKP
ncbi:hypothetical protein AAHA92_17466 [Salvia divinorum]|uniref:Uncharacterized protein n=1 Tax=Salvia divinorum TaxID=28513 RepID=A0ABD1GYW5_SALDI